MTDDDTLPDGDELAGRLADQERAQALLTTARAERAPSGLRARVEALRRPAPRRRLVTVGALAAGLAVVILLALVILPSGGLGPTVAEAAALGTRPATSPAPAVRPDAPALLDAAVEGVDFPAWEDEFGWAASGRRDDGLDGRDAVTVRYAKDGKSVAYTIVSGDGLAAPDDAAVTERGGVAYRTFPVTDGTAVTWERDGRTCVLTGPGVPEDVLLKLADWRGAGAVAF